MNQEQKENSKKEGSKLIISFIANKYLLETSIWAKLLAIVGLVFATLTLSMAFFANATLPFILPEGILFANGVDSLASGVFLFMGILYFFPAWYMLRFSQNLKSALHKQKNNELNAAFRYQKSFFKFWGILVACSFVVYFLGGLIALIMYL